MKNKIFILISIMLVMLLCSLDQMIVSTAMPQIVHELNGVEHLSWVFTAYMLAATVTMAIYGKLSDLFGRKKLYIVSIIIFLGASVLSGLAQDMTQLIWFRALQGIGGGAMMIISFALVGDVFPPAEQAKYQGMLGGVSALSSIVGPLMGGWITDHFSWRWTFYINLPIGIIALVVIITALPRIRKQVSAAAIDFAGAIFMTGTLVPMLLALVWGGNTYAWNSWEILGLSGGAVFSLIAFIISERRAKNAILALDLFRNRVFVVSALSAFITAMGMFAVILFIPIFGQGIIGITATHSGLILTPMMLSLILAAVISGQVISRTGKYKLLALLGMLLSALGMYFFATISINTTNSTLVFYMSFLGAGLGLTMPVFMLTAQNAFSRDRIGEVTAGAQLFKGLGGTVGIAILGGLMNTQLSKHLENVGGDPFVVMVKKVNPAQPFEMNFKTVQNLLNPQAQVKMKGMIATAPKEMQSQLSGSFDHFLQTVKIAFSTSLDTVFLVSMFIMLCGFIVVLFLPEIPLRKTNEMPGEKEPGIIPGEV
jgi:EmrB/QacA subfamily drug resistance transporter